MAAELSIAPEAEHDLAEAYGWYEARRAGLGEEFLGAVDACLHGILRNPEFAPGRPMTPSVRIERRMAGLPRPVRFSC